jgi:lysosomal Pro-X carboxypeptidase
VVTNTAGESCAKKVWNSFQSLFSFALTENGRLLLSNQFKLCSLLTLQNVESFGLFVQGAFDAMAMGDYSFPSSYISGNDQHPAPAWPMK